MNNNLLILGAGIYAVVLYEIAVDMQCFGRIAFLDDDQKSLPNGFEVIGRLRDLDSYFGEFQYVFVANKDSETRLSLIKRIFEETPYKIISLISPKAFVAESAQIMHGTVVEPMAVVHTGCIVAQGSIISSGAVLNYASMCCDGVYIGSNAIIEACSVVPVGCRIGSGEIFKEAVTMDSLSKDTRFYCGDNIRN